MEGHPSLLRALRHWNYRLFFAGQSLSLLGTWITRIATGWLLYRLTGSALLLGIVGFCGQIPTLFLAPPSLGDLERQLLECRQLPEVHLARLDPQHVRALAADMMDVGVEKNW